MEEIKINLRNEDDLLETYDNSVISSELINYIIDKAMNVNKYSDIKIIVNKNKIKLDIMSLIQDGLEREYNKSFMNYEKNNIIQGVLFLLGFVILIFSFILGDNGLWHEILLIIGWVPIWEMVHLELFTDFKERKKRAVLKKLMNSEIIVR